MSRFYSPLRYPGGKNCIFPFVSNLFYENNLIGTSYAEPYAGGSGLALRLLFEGYVNRVYLNDLDIFIYSFWKTVLDFPDDFCKWIETVKIDVKTWKKYKRIQQNADLYSQYEIAQAAFYLNRTNISGVIKGGIIGGLNQTGKYKIDARFNKKELISRINKIQSVANRIVFTQLDGIKFIRTINKSNESIFIYLDPPYFLKGSDLYMNFYKENDHRKLNKYVSKINQNWMVSYDKHKFILDLYRPNRKITYKLSQAASNRSGNEILIFDNNLSFENSMLQLSEARAITSDDHIIG